MKLILKRIACLTLAVIMIASVFSMTSCDVIEQVLGGGNTPPAGNNGSVNSPDTFVMEAEYVDFTGLVGGGHSNELFEEMMIYGNGSDEEKELGWSNGYFVSATHQAGICLTFNFVSDKEVNNATIVLRLGSEMGDLTFNPDNFEIKLNGDELDYNPMFVTNSARLEDMKFVDKTIVNGATILEGENVITLTVLPNTLAGGTTAGPIIDCIKITSGAQLDWEPLLDNPDKREEGI